jgi:hypothetical protein
MLDLVLPVIAASVVLSASMSMRMPTPVPAASPACAIEDSRRRAILAANYDAFDQSAEGAASWRSVMNDGCYETAASLILGYVDRNRARLSAEELRTLEFHAGQVFALAGDDAKAAPHFEKSLGGSREWRAYVEATLAFVRHDRAAFDQARRTYDRVVPKSPRRRVLAGLASCFGEPYFRAMMCESEHP